MLLRQRGWSLYHASLSMGFCQSAIPTALSRGRLPWEVDQWARALPALPSGDFPYSGDREGLQKYRQRYGLSLRKLGQVAGVRKETALKWLKGRAPVPSRVRAWLEAGAPDDWQWYPPGCHRYKPSPGESGVWKRG